MTVAIRDNWLILQGSRIVKMSASILSSMSGLFVVKRKCVRVSVGAARREIYFAERRGAGKGGRQRGAADPCRRAPFG
jgi:hypothetical protein